MSQILVAAGLFALFLGWNIANHYPLWTTFHGELSAALGVCCLFGAAAWPVARSAGPGMPLSLPLPPATRFCLAFALIPPLQFAAGLLEFRGDALMGALYIAGFALSIYVGHLWSAKAGRAHVLRLLHLTILTSAIVAAGLAFAQWMRLPASGWWAMELIGARPFGNLAQPNLFGLLQVMGIVAAAMLFEMRVLSSRASLYLVLAWLGTGLLICESRACLLALLLIVGWWFVTRRRVSSRLTPVEVLIALALAFVFYRWLRGIEEALFLVATDLRPALDVGPREWIWRHFGAAILSHPWLGHGFDQGSAALREVAASVAPSRNATFAHNAILDFMTWFGVPLAILASVGLVTWMSRWVGKTERADDDVAHHGVFAIWLALLVHSMLEFPYAHAFFLLPAALLAGAITPGSTGAGGPRASVSSVRASKPAVVACLLAMALLTLVTWDYLRFEEEFRENRFDKANFTGRVARPAAAKLHGLDHLAELNASAHIEPRPGMPPDELARLGKVSRRFHLLPTRFSYAKALALNGRMPEALAELQVLRSTHHPVHYRQIEADWRAWLALHPEIAAP